MDYDSLKLSSIRCSINYNKKYENFVYKTNIHNIFLKNTMNEVIHEQIYHIII